MPRKKCMMCKEWIDGEVINAIVGGKSMHFCSIKCQNKAFIQQKRNEQKSLDKNKVYRLICDILGVSEIINSILYKEWQVWNKVKTDGVIAQYLEENKDYLTDALSRISGTEYNRIRYLSAILKNNLGDYTTKVKITSKPDKKTEDFELFVPTVLKVVNPDENILEDAEDDLL